MDKKLFALLTREMLRENYKIVPFVKDQISEELIAEEDKNAIELKRK